MQKTFIDFAKKISKNQNDSDVLWKLCKEKSIDNQFGLPLF